MDFAKPIFDYVDTLVHASARGDSLATARHRAFIVPRLLISCLALALFPIYVAFSGAPGLVEVLMLAWLAAPILMVCYLSRTGNLTTSHALSALTLTVLGAALTAAAGGVTSFAVVWLLLVPLEAALSGNSRIVGFASLLVFSAVGVWAFLESQGLRAPVHTVAYPVAVLGPMSAALYAVALACGAHFLADANARALREEENRHRLLSDQMSDAVIRHSRNGSVIYASPAAAPMFGAAVGDLLGGGLLGRVHPADRAAYSAVLADAAEFGHQRSLEFRILRETNAPQVAQTIWLEIRCERLQRSSSSRRPEVVAVMRDITLQKQQAETIENMRHDIEQANSAAGTLLAIVGREQHQKQRHIAVTSDNRVKASA